MEYKNCLNCGNTYSKPYSSSKKSWGKSKFCSYSCNATFYRLGDSNRGKFGEESNVWKGDKIQKDSVHCWVARMWGSPKVCEICGTTEAKLYQWSNKNHKYTRIREEWQRVCKKCHYEYDVKNNGYKTFKFEKGNTYASKH